MTAYKRLHLDYVVCLHSEYILQQRITATSSLLYLADC